jgi:hypothetical protein
MIRMFSCTRGNQTRYCTIWFKMYMSCVAYTYMYMPVHTCLSYTTVAHLLCILSNLESPLRGLVDLFLDPLVPVRRRLDTREDYSDAAEATL